MHRFIQAMLAVLLVGVVLAGPANAAPADTIVGNGTPGTCTEAAFDTAVAAGGSITFNCGVPLTIPLTSPAIVGHDTTIDGGSVITLTGNLATQLFTVGVGKKLSLQNIILDKGFANHNSGGAIVNAGNLSLDNVVIQNSVAGVQGGAIWTSGPVSIRNSRLHDNSAKSGGAIAVPNPTPLTIDNSTLSGNTAQDAANGIGGAIQLGAGAQLTVTGGSLTDNQAAVEAGALDMSANSLATFEPGTAGGPSISFNSAHFFGGAISNNGGRLILQGADLEYNQTVTDTAAVGFGGAIDDEGAMVVNDSRLANNQARFGGALFVGGSLYNATGGITHTLFFANGAADLGGGLYTNVDTTTLTIADSRFEFNQAGSGGGLARTNAHLNISKSSFTANSAQVGGGMFLWAVPNPTDAGYVEVQDTTVSGNLATGGHSGGIDNVAQVDLRNVTLKDNNYGLFTDVGATSRLQSTVLDNPSALNCDQAGPSPTSGGHNLVTDNSCQLTGFQDQQGTSVHAMLGPLTSDPLVFTKFHVPQAGSPLINNGGPICSPTDQRYALRPNACDIGAIEFGGLLPRMFVPLIRK